ncbi:PREDICTED: uncharacterized protein At4g02000-like [Camelina sativa]|uniref:Uncharacterized protein At4g02000-like n=1 Tax=Camelina sativa TaxID=90675 RepID=A0ABM0SL89_CAMSA|nr:PREDICTED: uncharacterized protein At4g02000-like [Camelina sativa]
MSEELWNDLQYMVLGRDDPELFIPHENYAGMLARNQVSLIGRLLNPREQDLRRVISYLPPLWGIALRVHGRILDDSYVQFLFSSEVDMVDVLRMGPWMVDNWFEALQRWEDFPELEFLTSIDMWVQIRGIPLPYVSEATARFIAKTIGEIVHLDFNEETSSQIAFIRVKIGIGITDHLRFLRKVRFESSEKAMIGFEYEKLKRICTNCSRINHDSSHCPYLVLLVYHEDILDVPLAPVFEEGEGSNIYSFLIEKPSSLSSELSSYSPISQPPRPPTLGPNLEEFLAAYPPRTRPSSSSNCFGASSKPKDVIKGKEKVLYENGESSKRRKGKQIQVENERNSRQRRKGSGIWFYPTEH